MNEEQGYALGEVDRRLGNVVRIGTVAQIDHATGQVKVDLGDLVTDWIPWATPRAGEDRIWTTPDVGEQVVVASPGEPSQGVVIGSLFQTAHPQNGNQGKDRRITFSDGTVVEFDRTGSVLNVQVNPAGSIRLNIGGTTLLLEDGQATLTTPLLLVDAPQSTFSGNVLVEGQLTYQGGMSGSGGVTSVSGNAEFSGGTMTHNAKNIGASHTHTNVQPGVGTSGPPS
jgi:phage baseplate assembly protein V